MSFPIFRPRPWPLRRVYVGLALAATFAACGPEAPRAPSAASPADTDALGPPPDFVPEHADPAIAAQLETLIEAAREAPNDASRRASLGMAYEVAGLNAAAERCYRQATRLDPTEPRWAYYLAQVQAAQGELAGALETIGGVIALDGSYLPAWLWRGQWLLDVGRVDEARGVFQRVTALDAENHAAWIGLARAHLKLGEHARAILILERVARSYQHPQVFQLLGLAYRDAGDLERARTALAQGKPGPPPGWPDPWNRAKGEWLTGFGSGLRHAEALLAQGRPQQALAVLEQLRESRPDDVTLVNNLSVAYKQAGDPERALDVLRDGIERHPDYFPFHLNIANHYRDRGDLGRALEHLDRAIALNPTLGWAYQQKGTFLHEAGRIEESRDAIDTALTLDATNAAWFLFAARLEADLGNWDGAARRAGQAVHIDPASSASWLLLARAQVETGAASAARETLDRATRLGADPAAVAALKRRLDAS